MNELVKTENWPTFGECPHPQNYNQEVMGNFKIIFLKAFHAPENTSKAGPDHKAESIGTPGRP